MPWLSLGGGGRYEDLMQFTDAIDPGVEGSFSTGIPEYGGDAIGVVRKSH
jgi:hypothetical protein